MFYLSKCLDFLVNKTNVINLTSEYSELIGASLLAILKISPRRTAFVLQKLSGQQLTKNLREFIWSDILMRHERKKIETSAEVTDKLNLDSEIYFKF